MKVWIRKGQLNYFRKKAREAFPNEIQAFLIGKRSYNSVTIDHIEYPDLEISNPSMVQANAQSLEDIYNDAYNEGLAVVGSIHTHPNAPPILSPTDHKGHVVDGDAISGVVEVTKELKTRVVFWTHGSALRCDLKYIEGK